MLSGFVIWKMEKVSEKPWNCGKWKGYLVIEVGLKGKKIKKNNNVGDFEKED